ncbi:MAG TPA: hypothetical protein VGL51_10685 [Solirubrobacteraceae bacterium]
MAARARRRPGHWLLPALGLALATAFACAVAAEGVIAADREARSALAGSGSQQRSVEVSWLGPVTPAVGRRAQALLHGLGLPAPTRVALMNPVRLDGVIVRPAAISSLGHWVSGRAALPGACTPSVCPMLLAGGALQRRILHVPGVNIRVTGTTTLRSATPLGFVPPKSSGTPVLVTGDERGLDSLSGLSGVYRSHSWLSPLRTDQLQSWQLAGLERRLQAAQAALVQEGSQFSLSAPFAALDAARAEAATAPRRLLTAGGGALAALSVFLILTAYGLRRDQRDEVQRLQIAGARLSQRLVFSLGEAAALSACAVVAGFAVGIAVCALLAHAAGLPVGAVLNHSLLSLTGVVTLAAGWLLASAVIGLVLLAPGGRAADVLALAGAAALALALSRGGSTGGALAVLVAPLACVAAGVVVYRGAAALLRAGERLARAGPLPARLALVGLARAPVAPSLAIAFIAVSTGLAGFALAYRATLERGAADQAADQVPLDARLTPTPSFQTPLELAPLARWRRLAGGSVLAVRRTDATFTSGASSVTVPALGIPASGLALIHGWRTSDGSAPLGRLAARLRPPGPVRSRGPVLPAAARSLSLTMSAPSAAVEVAAELRDSAGTVTELPLGLASARPRTVTARLPTGRHELQALELSEPAGEQATTGHQNAENPAAATQFSTAVSLGPAVAIGRSGERLQRSALGRWDGVGAAAGSGRGGSAMRLRFADSGAAGVVRPPQPSDVRPVPVLVDPATAAAAARNRQIGLTVDGLPVRGVVVGVLRRFPTVPADAAGFVIADEATLAAALEASLPGQGAADELWIDTAKARVLGAALGGGALASLGQSFRSAVEHRLRTEPIAVGTLGTLAAAAGLGAVLAIVGLLAALVGALREPLVERDLAIQGLGPRALRRELQLRILLAGALGVLAGAAVAAVLTRLAVAAVRGGATIQAPRPPLVTVAPWGQLALGALGLVAAFALVGWLASAAVMARRRWA